MAQILMLPSLDDLWTGTVDALRDGELNLTANVQDDLQRLVSALQHGLTNLRDVGSELYQQLDATRTDQFDEAARTLAGDDEQFALLLREGLEDFELRGAVLTAWIYVLEELGPERDLLDDKLGRILAGEIPDGDFRFSFKCALYLAAIGAGVTAVIASGGGAVVLGPALSSSAAFCVHGWSGSGCPRVLPEISRYRR